MGSTNHGNQTVTYSYFESATSQNFNKRHIDIQPRGIYKGGYLTKVSNTEVTLSPFTLEIGDSSIQIGSKSSVNATLNSTTLDSGGISPATPYLVFRWAYTASQSNYVEIHAIASVSAAQSNDIIIGKCVFTGATLTGFSYTDRTFLSVQDLFLKVIPNEAGGMYVWVRSGRMHTSSACVLVPEQSVGPFSVPGSPNSRIDLVYVDSDGSIKIQQGAAGVSPSVSNYSGKSVIAEVRIVNGDTSIPASRITDVRAFMAATPATVDFSSIFGSWTNLDSVGSVLVKDSVYKVTSDGFVVASGISHGGPVYGYTSSANPPVTEVCREDSGQPNKGSLTMPVRKNEYWKITSNSTVTIRWIPIGSGQCVKQ